MGITLRHEGNEYSGWTSISVDAGLSEATRSFTATLAEVNLGGMGDAYWIAPGDAVEIYADGILILSGYANEYRPSFDANSHSVTVSGRGKSQDAVDCSAAHPTGRFENQSISQIASELAGIVGITVSYDGEDTVISKFQVNQGEKIVNAIHRLAASHGLTLYGLADGNMALTKGTDNDRLDGIIKEGQWPMLSGSAELKDTKRFSDYEYKSQLAGGEDRYGVKAALEVSKVTDAGVTRYRPFVGVVEVSADAQRAGQRAAWQQRRIAGKNVKVDLECQGFKMNANQLWEPNKLIYVRSPTLKINHELLIDSVTYSQDSGGSKTKLSLVPPKSAGSKAGKKGAVSTQAGGSQADGLDAFGGEGPTVVTQTPFDVGSQWTWPGGAQ